MRILAPAWLPYFLPLALFLALTSIEHAAGDALYPALYTAKIAIVAALMVVYLRRGVFPEVRPQWGYLPAAIVLGAGLCAAWVGIDRVTPHFRFLGSRTGYDPFVHLHGAALPLFIGVRFAGLVAVSPLIEELFYRSFVLRFAIDPLGFNKQPIGVFEPISFGFAVILMAAGHPEWLAAAVFSAAMNVIVYRTKSVFACYLTHAATNLALGIYIIYAHAWAYW